MVKHVFVEILFLTHFHGQIIGKMYSGWRISSHAHEVLLVYFGGCGKISAFDKRFFLYGLNFQNVFAVYAVCVFLHSMHSSPPCTVPF